MRPFVQAKTISLYLERLEEATKLLEPLKEVTERGKSWLEETEENSLTFIQMCQILDDVSASFGQKMTHFLSQDSNEQCVDQRSIIKEASDMTSVSENYNLLLKRLEEAEERINSLSHQSHLMGSKDNEMCSEIKDIVNKLGNKSNKIEVQFETLSEKYVSLQHNLHQQEKMLEDLKETITRTHNIESNNSEKVEECLAEMSETAEVLSATKIHVNTLSTHVQLQDSSLKIHQLTETTSNLSQKVEALTEDINNATFNNRKLSEKIIEDQKKLDLQYKILCQLFTKRLTPLETLQSVFNTRLKTRDENLDTINKLSRKMVDLETAHRSRSGSIAFSAELKGYKFFKTGRIIKKYFAVFCDEGNNFNPETGEFTAPVDGVYLVSATIVELNGMYVNIGVYVKTPGFHDGDGTLIGVTQTNTAENSACSVNVAAIKAGDKVFLKIDRMEKGAELLGSTIFTCIKL